MFCKECHLMSEESVTKDVRGELQENLYTFGKRAIVWGMTFSAVKCKMMCTGTKIPDFKC